MLQDEYNKNYKNKKMLKFVKFFLILLFSIGLFSGNFQSVTAIEDRWVDNKSTNSETGVENGSSWFVYNLKFREVKEYALRVINLLEKKILSSDLVTAPIMPWRELSTLILLLVIIIAAYLFWKKHYKKKYGGIGWVKYKVKKTDTIAKISEKYKIDHNILARTNKIKAPYLLNIGEDILVPFESIDLGVKKSVSKSKFVPETIKKKLEKKIAKPEKAMDKKNKGKIDNIVRLAKKNKERVQVEIMPSWLNRKVIIISMVATVFLIVALILSIVNFMKNKHSQDNTKNKKISITSVSPEKIETGKLENTANKEIIKREIVNKDVLVEAVNIDITKTGIKVLNGGSEVGAAGMVRDLLIKQGYISAEAANAENAKHQGQAIYYHKEFQQVAAEIQKILSLNYPDIPIKEGAKAEEKSEDIVVMLGK